MVRGREIEWVGVEEGCGRAAGVKEELVGRREGKGYQGGERMEVGEDPTANFDPVSRRWHPARACST